jgi:hypothetical protein
VVSSELARIEIRLPPRYLRPKSAALYTSVSLKTLEAMRRSGDGPRFSNVGRSVFYDLADLDAFMAARRVRNTAEAFALTQGGVA